MRTIRRLEAELGRRTRRLLARIADDRPFDFLRDVAAELPMQAISILLGVPEENRHALVEAVEHTFDFRDGRESFDTSDAAAAAHGRMSGYDAALIATKRRRPTDDMLSTAVHATLRDVEPATLSDAELYAFFALLFAAGAEATRNAIAGGVLALIEHPAVLDRLRADPTLLPGAIEEMLRHTGIRHVPLRLRRA
jgi:cytochrome P450